MPKVVFFYLVTLISLGAEIHPITFENWLTTEKVYELYELAPQNYAVIDGEIYEMPRFGSGRSLQIDEQEEVLESTLKVAMSMLVEKRNPSVKWILGGLSSSFPGIRLGAHMALCHRFGEVVVNALLLDPNVIPEIDGSDKVAERWYVFATTANGPSSQFTPQTSSSFVPGLIDGNDFGSTD